MNIVRSLIWLGLIVSQLAGAQTIAPMSITLDEMEYPYPVRFHTIPVEGQSIRMAYMDIAPTAKANGKVVVLMHGKNFGSFYWKNTIAVLRDAGYRVLAIDQAGFGKSSKPDIHYSFHLLASNTHLLLHFLGIEKIILVGHSTGGMLATRYALMYPDEVSKLLLEDPIGLEDYRLIVPYNTVDELYQEEMNTPDSVTINYIKSYFVKWKPEYEIYAQILNRWKRSEHFAVLAKSAAITTEMIYEQPVCYEFPHIKARTLIVVGAEDRTVVGKAKVPKALLPTTGLFPQMAMKVSAAMPEATYKVIEKTGHIPHIESPETFYQILLNFLQEP